MGQSLAIPQNRLLPLGMVYVPEDSTLLVAHRSPVVADSCYLLSRYDSQLKQLAAMKLSRVNEFIRLEGLYRVGNELIVLYRAPGRIYATKEDFWTFYTERFALDGTRRAPLRRLFDYPLASGLSQELFVSKSPSGKILVYTLATKKDSARNSFLEIPYCYLGETEAASTYGILKYPVSIAHLEQLRMAAADNQLFLYLRLQNANKKYTDLLPLATEKLNDLLFVYDMPSAQLVSTAAVVQKEGQADDLVLSVSADNHLWISGSTRFYHPYFKDWQGLIFLQSYRAADITGKLTPRAYTFRASKSTEWIGDMPLEFAPPQWGANGKVAFMGMRVKGFTYDQNQSARFFLGGLYDIIRWVSPVEKVPSFRRNVGYTDIFRIRLDTTSGNMDLQTVPAPQIINDNIEKFHFGIPAGDTYWVVFREIQGVNSTEIYSQRFLADGTVEKRKPLPMEFTVRDEFVVDKCLLLGDGRALLVFYNVIRQEYRVVQCRVK